PFAVIVDGRSIPAVHATLLDLLRTSPSSSGLLAQAAASGGEPLLIVDGIRVIGAVSRLAQMSVADVARVTTSRSLDASKQYGAQGYYGAILVETKKGR
ncbi:MAG: hypothetical protein ACREMQ_11335, partial [Longimicrobiales bacterium]